MTEVILHLGTNIGFRDINLELTRIMISNHIGIIKTQSQLYNTAAWGIEEQDDFLNQALICETSLIPQELLSQIHLIEAKMGRQRELRWGPRIIDIDIIFYGEEIIENPNLKIPHPQLTNRNFVLIPLLDICPDKVHPVHSQTIRQLAEACEDSGEVSLYSI